MQTITVWSIAFRLLAAMAVGLIVGGQRTRTAHPAGLRTHMLVALGACVVMIIGSQLYQDTHQLYQSAPDPARLGAQVISGVGFLGAGTILKDGITIRGLTTAASLWTVACLGLATGMGYYLVALLGSLAVLITLSALDKLQARLQKKSVSRLYLKIECQDLHNSLLQIEERCDRYRVAMSNLTYGRQGDDSYMIRLRLSFAPGSTERDKNRFFCDLSNIVTITGLENQEE